MKPYGKLNVFQSDLYREVVWMWEINFGIPHGGKYLTSPEEFHTKELAERMLEISLKNSI